MSLPPRGEVCPEQKYEQDIHIYSFMHIGAGLQNFIFVLSFGLNGSQKDESNANVCISVGVFF
jgi:hypothetical protein